MFRVQLEKGPGGEFEVEPHQTFGDVLLPCQVNHLLTPDKWRITGIDILHDGNDLWQLLGDRFQEGPLVNQLGGIGDQGQLKFAGCPGFADDDGLDNAAVVVFIVNGDLQVLNQLDDCPDNLHCPGHLNCALLHINEVMAVRLVQARRHMTVHHPDLELGLVTVVVFFRSGNCLANVIVAVAVWLKLGETIEDNLPLKGQLLRVGEAFQLKPASNIGVAIPWGDPVTAALADTMDGCL